MPAFRRVGLFLCLAALAACDSGTDPAPPPAKVEVLSGNAQTGVVATPLAVAPKVRVLTASGKAARNAAVTFQLSDPTGSLGVTTATADANGEASPGTWILGTKAGTQTLTATVQNIAPVTINATATPAPASKLSAVFTAPQVGTAGTVAANSPAVRVTDAYDNPIEGFEIHFVVMSGGGSVANAIARSGSDGVAAAGAWTLGTAVGANSVAASGVGLSGSPVLFSATGNAGEAARIVMMVQPPATTVNGSVLTAQPVVRIGDQFGNAVARAGVTVTASAGNARMQNATAVTDANGVATFSGLSMAGTAGAYQLRFSATGLTAATATQTALTAGAAAQLGLANNIASIITSGAALNPQPVIEIRDQDSNRVSTGAEQVTVALQGPGSLSGATTATAEAGRAAFTDLMYTGAGPFRLAFSSPGLPTITTAEISVGVSVNGCIGPRALLLNYTLGQSARYRTNNTSFPNCIQFDATRNLGQQYLVMIENMPPTGFYETAMFPGANSGSVAFNVSLTTGLGPATPAVTRPAVKTIPEGMSHAWDFGDGPIYEWEPEQPVGGVPRPVLLRGADRISINSADAAPAVGDTVIVFLAGVQRLGTVAGNQKAVIRLVSNELIIAEDVRLATMPRTDGKLNSPIAQNDLDEIARLYALHPKAQADLLFQNQHNAATVAAENRIIAVHTMMPSDGVWGYTYSSTNVFAWDYWVLSDGSTKGLAQHSLRNAHNLFMHEIAHIRHWGMLERATRTDIRGNRWLVEGFARFTERLPIGSYLMNSPDLSRTGNVQLPRYSEYNNLYYRDDVPTFLSMAATMFDGYQSSSYVFDYFADQVAAAGGNWRTALYNFVTYAGVESELNNAINAFLPGLTFGELFTRARIALFMDDLDSPGLPAWTQYLQYQLRASRPAGTAATVEPRNVFGRVVPGIVFNEVRQFPIGSAWGYVIDGSMASGNASLQLDFGAAAQHGVLSVTRIR